MNGLNEGTGPHLKVTVVKIWGKDSGMVNLTVFDDHACHRGNEPVAAVVWRETSIRYSDAGEANTWLWNQFVQPVASTTKCTSMESLAGSL